MDNVDCFVDNPPLKDCPIYVLWISFIYLRKKFGDAAMTKRQSYYIQTDLLILITLFITMSLFAIYNAEQLEQYATENFVMKQIVWFTVGILFASSVQFLDMEQLYKGAIYL